MRWCWSMFIIYCQKYTCSLIIRSVVVIQIEEYVVMIGSYRLIIVLNLMFMYCCYRDKVQYSLLTLYFKYFNFYRQVQQLILYLIWNSIWSVIVLISVFISPIASISHLNMLCSIEGYVEFTSRSYNHTCSCY